MDKTGLVYFALARITELDEVGIGVLERNSIKADMLNIAFVGWISLKFNQG